MFAKFSSAALLVASAVFLNGASAADSDFELDSRLHRSLWGMAYTPENSAYYPNCGDTIAQVTRDMQLMSQLTTRVRLYGTDCDQLTLVLQAIQNAKLNLHVFTGIYIDGNETTYARQRDTTFAAFDEYGVDNILGITVGNEYLLQVNTANPAELPEAEALLLEKIAEVRSELQTRGYSKTIPVGSADAGSMITPELSEAADYIMANTHPFFSGVTIEEAADWTAQYLINDEPRYATAAGKPLYNAEIGWPTNADTGGDLTLNGSAASIPNVQILLDTFVCQANQNATNGYFWFELFDANWKTRYGGAEPYWGLFDPSPERVLKDGITIPECEASLEPALPGMNDNTGGNGGSGNGNGNGNGNDNGNGNNNSAGQRIAAWGSVVLGIVVAGGAATLF